MQKLDWTDPWLIGLGIAGLANLGNGAWMLADPAGWYAGLPAAVPDTGPLNPHFVRDIGSAFVMIGAALVLAALRPRWRAPALAMTTLFYLLHALVHVTDTIAGRLPSSHWSIDFPGVYFPALVLIAVTVAALRRTDA
jgi:hypothetical protein